MLLLLPCLSNADPGNNYCVTPPFVSGNIAPNLLLMIDNSASMYDLAYVDQGKKHCSGSSTSCFYDSDCPTGQTCNVFDRQPFYCYDETYSSANSYYGYFDSSKFYYYRSATDDFAPVAGSTLATVISTAPSTCGTGIGTVTKTIPDTMCVEYNPAGIKSLVSFVAKGSYLNWLTASKFDTEKQILTGGRFDGASMIPESRGCVGQGFVKDANTADFVNFSDGDSDPNQSLQITFTITGAGNPNNPTAPSRGGQTYINLFGGADFNYSNCQQAIQDLATGGNADIKQSVDACLASTGTPSGYCSHIPVAPSGKTQLPGMTCAANSDCYLNIGSSATYVCEYNTAKTCSGTSDSTSCKVAAMNSCAGDPTISCSSDSQCNITLAAKSGTCSTDKTLYNGSPGKNDTPPTNKSCTTDSTCTWSHGTKTFTAKSGACVGYTPSSTINKGPCQFVTAADYGPCTANYVGDCIVSAQAAATKTKVDFQQSMQECWKIRGQTHTAADNYGFSNVNTIKNQCPDIYASYKTCHNNHLVQCATNTDCAADGSVTCDAGPSAIAAGNPALLCGSNYAGQYYHQDASGNWVLIAGTTDLQLAAAEYQFCGDIQAPTVTDPTDSPSDTAIADNLPAIVSGIGVEAQLGSPIAKMRAKVAATSCSADSDCGTGSVCSGGICKPQGLLQKFGSQMRIGAMSFNPVGSASETALSGVRVPMVCSNDSSIYCTQNIDCGSGNTCVATTAGSTNLDGGRVIYPVGKGLCTTMTTTACTTDAGCSGSKPVCYNGFCGNKGSAVCTTALTCTGSSQACIRDSVGDHTTDSLVKTIDTLPANAWTPFAETFYNALGYFAAVPQSDGSFKSRVTGASGDPTVTNIRLNALRSTSTDFSSFSNAPVDFNESLNPSEYRCQQNYVLLVTDGSSTADRSTAVSQLSSLYAGQAQATAGNCPADARGVDHGGTSNLPILSFIGRHQNLASFSTTAVTPLHCSATTTQTCSADSDCPNGESCTNGRNPRDYVTTYVVLNGADTGGTGVCDAEPLLSKTALNGGTTLKKAEGPAGLNKELTTIFQNIAAKASSGTAASILSNSEGSGANILQAVFYPKKIFDNQTSTNWIGEMQNLWYYVDPMINHSTIREDTDGDRTLDLVSDHVVSLRFDPTDNTTYAYTSIDTNGDGVGDTPEVKEVADAVNSVWRAGKLLWSRDLSSSPRTIYTTLLPSGTEVTGTGLMTFTYGTMGGTAFADNSTVLKPYLQMPDSASTIKLMKYVHGFDFPGDNAMRSRTVQIGSIPALSFSTDAASLYVSNPRDKGIGVWKLGDIISSTPRIQSNVRLNSYGLQPPSGYGDVSYNSYIASNDYKNRGMVYVGANDGMLHAFKLGLLDVTASVTTKARLTGSNLGQEQWAFIPKQSLPYLNYYSDPAYNHIYFMDGSTTIVDASIGDRTGSGGCTKLAYDTCVKLPSVVDGSNNLASSSNTWRTVLIGGMGLGGASTAACPNANGSNCVQTPATDPATGSGLGYSSYYALDITDPQSPSLLWEFSDPALGYATSGPAIVRVGDPTKNGRWFAVFGSGPTGPIDTANHQFMGRSDQTLKFFIVDLRTGAASTIDTGIANAFAGSMIGGAIDADRWNTGVTGNYQDDAIYVGYTKKSDVTGAWTDGGVLRIVTNESSKPLDAVTGWKVSTVIDSVGPVTSAISRLQDRKNRILWLYFGTGRYYSRASGTIDDYNSQQAIYGIHEKCYNSTANPGNFLDKTCTTATKVSDLTDQSTTITSAGSITDGWKVLLDPHTDSYGAERVVTDAVALTNGTVFVTSFEPTADPCGFGGNSFLWALDYRSGARPQDAALAGKALIQLSTGEFKEIDLSQTFGAGAARLMRRTGAAMTGKPPADAFPVISKSGNKPVKRLLHIQER
jgi:type IV pilus assembly protein PilY1